MRSRNPRIAYFVSSHGFGHAARTRTILRHLQHYADVTVYSTIPSWFWGDLDVAHIDFQSDVGCIQTRTLTIDEAATRSAFDEFVCNKTQRLDFMDRQHFANSFDLIATDISPEPLEFASGLSIPSALIANFTWVEIYGLMPCMSHYIDNLLIQYKYATATYIPSFQTGMNWVDDPQVLNGVADLGESIRHRLDPESQYQRVVYIDAGRWGTDICWQNATGHAGTLFVRIGDPIDGLPDNVLQLRFGTIRHADLVKSVDTVVSKPGYGIVTECLANKTHWCCIRRNGFLEDEILIRDASMFGTVTYADVAQLTSLAFDYPASRSSAVECKFDGASQITGQLLALIQN